MNRVLPSPFRASRQDLAGTPTFRVKEFNGHSYGCLLAPIPSPLAEEIRDWAHANIPLHHLGGGGFEDNPHVTIKYGFDTANVRMPVITHLRHMLAAYGPVSIHLRNLSVFEKGSADEDGDVLKVDVESAELHELNRIVTDFFPCVRTHPTYKPHVTLAYLKPGFAKAWAGFPAPFVNTRAFLDLAVYSTRDGQETAIPFGAAPGKTLSYLDSTRGGALVPPPARGRKVRPSPFRTSLNPEKTVIFSKSLKTPGDKPQAPKVRGSYFRDCPRGKDGRCLPKGQAGERAVPRSERPKYSGEFNDSLGRRVCYQEGRRTPCGRGGPGEGGKPSPQPKAPTRNQPPAPKTSVDSAREKIQALKNSGTPLTPDHVREMGQSLMGLTTKQLVELKKSLGVKASGLKLEMAKKIAERALGLDAQAEQQALDQGAPAEAPAGTTPAAQPTPEAPAETTNAGPEPAPPEAPAPQPAPKPGRARKKPEAKLPSKRRQAPRPSEQLFSEEDQMIDIEALDDERPVTADQIQEAVEAASGPPARQQLRDVVRRSENVQSELDGGPENGLIDLSAAQELGAAIFNLDNGVKVPLKNFVRMAAGKASRGFYPDEASWLEANAVVAETLDKYTDEEAQAAAAAGELDYLRRRFGQTRGGTYYRDLERTHPAYVRFLQERLGATPEG